MSEEQVLDPQLLQILACPKCKGELELVEEGPPQGDEGKTYPELGCGACKLAYRIEDGIPVMLIDEARQL